MAEGFLGRWSRRKQQVRAGGPAAAPSAEAAGEDAPAAPVEHTAETLFRSSNN